MFFHSHPYPPFIPDTATKLVVGTLPPPRFTTGKLLEGDVNFCYGSKDGQLWPILNKIFDLNLKFENTQAAILQRKEFLENQKIGICDIVESCYREKVDASDLGMLTPKYRNLLKYLKEYPSIHTLLFTGGNSKNGPEYFFRKYLKKHGVVLEIVSNEVPRIHQFKMGSRTIKTISLTAPSGAANRAVGSMPLYKKLKSENADFNTIDFRIMQYEPFFRG
ncbi:uracil-DNA glycosylase family protein [Ascidiimonas sp. W6]|uniref:uracil-DNA glycosylase family protein n=1 Tax=Ascidiimonas meishanensis TaxID=3128903 RepID=UPI0030EC5E5E